MGLPVREAEARLAAQPGRAPEPEIRIEYEPRREGLRLVLVNRGNEPCTFRLSANVDHHRWEPLTFRVPARGHRDHFLPLKFSANWYDFTVRVHGLDAFSRRFAGTAGDGPPRAQRPRPGRPRARRADLMRTLRAVL